MNENETKQNKKQLRKWYIPHGVMYKFRGSVNIDERIVIYVFCDSTLMIPTWNRWATLYVSVLWWNSCVRKCVCVCVDRWREKLFESRNRMNVNYGRIPDNTKCFWLVILFYFVSFLFCFGLMWNRMCYL